LRSLQAVDEAVERIVAALSTAGRLNNTYVMFTNDDGYLYGDHRIRLAKTFPYEPSIRVPLLVRGPNVPAGVVDRAHLIANADLAPTFLRLAGLTVPATVDGRSFHPMLRATVPPETVVRTAMPLRYFDIPNDPYDAPSFRGVRTLRHTWVEWADGSKELYDNIADPWQLRNLASNPALATLRSGLRTLTQALTTCIGAVCRAADHPISAGP
jgi:arylsulfatase A-like enzyme